MTFRLPDEDQLPDPFVALLPGVLAQAPIFVGVHDTSGPLVYTNRTGYGIKIADCIGKTIAQIAPAGTDLTTWSAAFRAAALGSATDFRFRMATPDHAPGYAEFIGRMGPLRSAVGEVTHVIVIAWDVTTDFPQLAASLSAARAGPNPLRRYVISEEQQAIVDLLRVRGPQKGTTIGKAIGHTSSRLRVILADMMERGILLRAAGGYSVNGEFLRALE